jgi:hypothetical protein
LGALAYNFRQDIGDAFIRLGHEISGDRRAAAPAAASDQTPAPQNAQPKSPDLASTIAKPSQVKQEVPLKLPTHHIFRLQTERQRAYARKKRCAFGERSGGVRAGPAVGTKPRETSPVEERTDVAAKPQTPLEPATGQEEFNIAREILQGSNRKRELPRAVDLLWSGVRKGYVPAEVTLADLFLRATEWKRIVTKPASCWWPLRRRGVSTRGKCWNKWQNRAANNFGHRVPRPNRTRHMQLEALSRQQLFA